ncbi:MAG: HAD family hydrolase [Thermodesulfobacteriota bacterium]|nr:HAD family hydrolase [Thermodesulfobacteriota bacterium]
MTNITDRIISLFSCLLFLLLTTSALATTDPLPSWHEGPSKKAITAFVGAVTDKSSPDFVKPSERIAVFDNDGTLWSEQPAYFQLFFAMDRVKAMATDHPEWKSQQPFQAVLEGDMKALAASGKKGLIELVMTTHAGMTADEFTTIVKNWLQTAKHPTLKKPYTDLVFKPMLELLDYLRANDFKTFIVSGGGIEFMRPWVEGVYGIPPEQVVGSSIVSKFEMRDGKPVLIREAKLNFIDDKEGKPVGINQHIGRRPIFAFGNSDGDLQMLQWTTLAGEGKRFAGIVHHTDGEREFAYDRDSHMGRLDKALVEAKANGWTVVDMKKEWNVIYP